MHVIIRARAPLRLGLAGGGTDLRWYSDLFGGAVVNTTICRFVNLKVENRDDGKIVFTSYDTGTSEAHDADNILKSRQMPLYTAAYNKILSISDKEKPIPIHIESISDSPVGSGLGTSSTLTVTLVKALSDLFEVNLNRYEIAELAYQIEREDCGFTGGLQDHYAASFGGFNQFIFHKNRSVSVRPIQIERSFMINLETQILLYFSGVSRVSSSIIDDQIRAVKELSDTALNSMHGMKEDAMEMKGVLMRGDLERFSGIIKEGWIRKKETSDKMTNGHIDELIDTLFERGIKCAKVSGAGGGGFIYMVVPLNKREEVTMEISKREGFHGGCRFTEHGVESWRE